MYNDYDELKELLKMIVIKSHQKERWPAAVLKTITVHPLYTCMVDSVLKSE